MGGLQGQPADERVLDLLAVLPGGGDVAPQDTLFDGVRTVVAVAAAILLAAGAVVAAGLRRS
ncbi:hypothetical protein JHN55_25970 [Streptomyces sp. MBT56]|nr:MULTISPECIES: hypothetical protein [unclassified Streptomyces]MBK3559909.1 hypothetical protein [Streptomyces sp. MBT56]MBK3601618.1 hypothetical protein [Streptomyces sp. MBT54]MBK3613210.1 hypothetical protein [Streptomyces sp. MBT98]MBK6041163.1 hypothetical protein [Streptomyces sp. MBT55]